MDPKCPNPFLCSYQSEYKEELNERLQTFFDFYYFVFYFTTKAFTDYGHIKFVVNEGFSSNFDLHEEYMADIFPIIHTKKSYMDDTIMPWYNNKTYEFMAWDGFMLPNVF